MVTFINLQISTEINLESLQIVNLSYESKDGNQTGSDLVNNVANTMHKDSFLILISNNSGSKLSVNGVKNTACSLRMGKVLHKTILIGVHIDISYFEKNDYLSITSILSNFLIRSLTYHFRRNSIAFLLHN